MKLVFKPRSPNLAMAPAWRAGGASSPCGFKSHPGRDFNCSAPYRFYIDVSVLIEFFNRIKKENPKVWNKLKMILKEKKI